MSDMFNYFMHLNKFNWGDGPYQWFFYAGIILTLTFEKNKIARIIFGWLPIAFLLSIYNPLFNKLIRIVFPNPDAYYVRMFSFIPVTYGIGVGFMQIITKMRGWTKAIFVGGMAVIIAFTCTDVYQSLGMTPSANAEKVPEGIFEIIAAVHKENADNVCVAVPYPLSTSIRQVDSKIITPYGRDDELADNLHRELSQSVPNPYSAMIEAGKRGVDYIVVNRNDECRVAFQQQGYEPYAEISGFIIYKVEKVPQLIRQLDDKNRIKSLTSIDEYGIPIKTEKGYTKKSYEYDSYGYRIKETYLDETGEKYTLPAGYSSIKRKYRFPSGLLESIIYLNDKDEMVLVNGCYEIRNTYDNNKRLIKESFYDQYGNNMIRTDLLYAARKMEYNKDNQIVRESFYDTNDMLVMSSSGYASYSREFDNKKRVISINYYDVNNHLTRNRDGYASINKQYDEKDNIISETYFDENGDPVNNCFGFFSIERIYDGGTLIQEIKRDIDGNVL